jgi:hypothetical protein
VAQEQSLAPGSSSGESQLRVRRGRVESVDLYEIKDTELELMERGSPADLQLNFAIFLLSLAISGVCALATATFKSPKVEIAFMVATFCGGFMGLYLLVAWWRNRTSLRDVCKRIRLRIPPEIAAALVVSRTSSETTTIVESQSPKG